MNYEVAEYEVLDMPKSGDTVVVGMSGGVDSTFLLAVAHEVLGEKAIAVTSADVSVPKRELMHSWRDSSQKGISMP